MAIMTCSMTCSWCGTWQPNYRGLPGVYNFSVAGSVLAPSSFLGENQGTSFNL